MSVVTLLHSTLQRTDEDPSVPYGETPNLLKERRHVASFNMEEAPRSWLRALRNILGAVGLDLPEDSEASAELASLTPITEVQDLLEKILDRTVEDIMRMSVTSASAFYHNVRDLNLQGLIFFGGRQFPVPLQFKFSEGRLGPFCAITAEFWLHDQLLEHNFDTLFEIQIPKAGLSISKIFQSLNIQLASPEQIRVLEQATLECLQFQNQFGRVMVTESPVFVASHQYWSLRVEQVSLGFPGAPRQLIVEGELEVRTSLYQRQGTFLPFVRCFSLDLKTYVYVPHEELKPHVFLRNAKELVVLQDDVREFLDRIFTTHTDQIYGDLFHHRHGGMVLMLSGSPGVGKTLTAEAFSASSGRPLYTLGVGELGTSSEKVEAALGVIFARVQRWNAILLFDEGDIFLTQRQDSDLERSAIVGVFLRILDQYQGILLITTNRPEVLDKALLSRVTAHLRYLPFTVEMRMQVWKRLLDSAGLSMDSGDLYKVAESEIDGRAIRNIVRLLGVQYPGSKEIRAADVAPLLRYKA